MKLVKLGNLASIQTGKIDVNKAVSGGKYPFFTCSRDVYEINDAPFEGKAVLVAGNGDLNVKYYEGKFNAYQRTYFLFVNNEKELIPRYLYWFLESYVGQLRSESIGSTIKYIKMGNLTEAEIPLLSLEKQRQIIEKLDSSFAEIDLLEEIHTRSNKELLDNLFGTYRDSLLTSACAGSSLVEFGEIGDFVRGPFGGSLKKSMFKDSGVAVYEQQHAIYSTFQNFRYFVDDKKFQEMKRFEVKTNDLIMSCSGTYGKIAVVPEGSPKGIINQALLKITPSSGVRSQFLKHWMQSSLFQVELEKEVGGAALQNVPSVAKMKSIKIRLPNEKIQIETVEKLDEFQSEIELATLTQESIKSNYIALRESLLSNAFSQEEAVA